MISLRLLNRIKDTVEAEPLTLSTKTERIVDLLEPLAKNNGITDTILDNVKFIRSSRPFPVVMSTKRIGTIRKKKNSHFWGDKPLHTS